MMSLCGRYVLKVSAMNLDLQYISLTQPLPELRALESLFPSMHLKRNYLEYVSIVLTSGLLEAGAAGGGGRGCPSPIITSTPSSCRCHLLEIVVYFWQSFQVTFTLSYEDHC